MRLTLGFTLAAAFVVACSSSNPASTTGSSTSSVVATSSSSASSNHATSTSSGTGGLGTGGTSPGGGDAGTDAPVNMCSAAIAQLLESTSKVSTGVVSVLSTSGSTSTIYVDASAGGFGATGFPRVYIDLGKLMRVDITDEQSTTSTAWDLAIKRPVLFTNDGDGGIGGGGNLVVSKAFDQVTAADAKGTFAIESFVDDNCNPKTDDAGDVMTTFTGWYDYDQATNVLTPHPNTTYVVRGAKGTLYKVGILGYYAEPDGGMGTLGGYYTLQVAAL